MLWRGVAWRGVAWRGVVWCGVAWRGVAWQREMLQVGWVHTHGPRNCSYSCFHPATSLLLPSCMHHSWSW